MKDMLLLLAHLLTTIAKLLRPGGARAIVADSLLMKQQLIIINRYRTHQSLGGETPAVVSGDPQLFRANLRNYSWQSHCKDHFQTPITA